MEKRIRVERFGPEGRPRREKRCQEEGYHRRHEGRYEERRHEREREHRHHRKPHFKHMHRRLKVKTKMFMDKLKMVEFVNDQGEFGHKIDVFKIEENLYKVEVTEFPQPEVEEEIEVELEG